MSMYLFDEQSILANEILASEILAREISLNEALIFTKKLKYINGYVLEKYTSLC